MEQVSEEPKAEIIDLLSYRLKQAEIVLAILQMVSFAWLVILLFQVLNGAPSIVEYPAMYGNQYGVWIQGVQFSQLILAVTFGGFVSVLRLVLSSVPGIARWVQLHRERFHHLRTA